MALNRTEIDRAYLKRHNLKRFNLMASEDSLKRLKELANSKKVRVGEMLEILLDVYQSRPRSKKEEAKASPAIPAGVEQMSLF